MCNYTAHPSALVHTPLISLHWQTCHVSIWNCHCSFGISHCSIHNWKLKHIQWCHNSRVSMAQRIWKNMLSRGIIHVCRKLNNCFLYKFGTISSSFLSERHTILGSYVACERLSRNLQPPSAVKTNVSFVVSIKAFQLFTLRFWKDPSLHAQLCQCRQLCQCC